MNTLGTKISHLWPDLVDSASCAAQHWSAVMVHWLVFVALAVDLWQAVHRRLILVPFALPDLVS